MAVDDLAQQLWHARCTGGVVDAARVSLPTTLGDAYAIQARVAELAGAREVGFKIGSTSLEAQRHLGTTEPGSAALLEPFVHKSPAHVPISSLHMPAVEGEFAFRLGRALPPQQPLYSREDVADAVEAVAGAIEVVGTRFAGGLSGKGRLLTTADGGVNIALVTGPWFGDWQRLDLVGHRVTMRINGRQAGEGTGARALGDPMNVLIWLANQQSKLGVGLAAGAVISTGTCTGLDAVKPGDHVVADFGGLGSIAITFSDMTPT